MIVFPLTEGAYTDPLYRKGGKEYGSRISWQDVAAGWSKGESYAFSHSLFHLFSLNWFCIQINFEMRYL